MEIDFELIQKILETVEGMDVVESFLVFPVTAFDFAVVPRGIWLDGFMCDTKTCGGDFEEGELFRGIRTETVGELVAVVGLDAVDGDPVFPVKGDRIDQKDGGRMGTVFIEPHQKAQSGKLIDGGVLVEVLPWQAIGQQEVGTNLTSIWIFSPGKDIGA